MFQVLYRCKVLFFDPCAELCCDFVTHVTFVHFFQKQWRREDRQSSDSWYHPGKKQLELPSRGLTYPTLGKGKSSSTCHFGGCVSFLEGTWCWKFAHDYDTSQLTPFTTLWGTIYLIFGYLGPCFSKGCNSQKKVSFTGFRFSMGSWGETTSISVSVIFH